MTAAQRRRASYAEAVFWACNIPPVILLLPHQYQIKYLQFVSIYAIIRSCIVGAQADTPDD